MTNRQHLVDEAALIGELARDDPPTVLDVRWTLTGGGRAAYEANHLPGAVFVDLDADLAAPPGAGGRHPLPDPGALQAALRRAGVRAGHPVVVYDAGGVPPTGAAARAWWILRWAGLADVRVLDGGYAAWVAAGGALTADVPVPAPGDVTVRAGALPAVDAEGARAVAAGGVLIDARVTARYRGETEPVDAVAGHIPGARNQPAAETVDADGRLLAPERLRARYADLGVRADRPVGAYCGSGVTAAQTALALTVAGFAPVLYVGSWSHWITDPDRPIAVGEERP
ncbi:sulfurtransferase [Planosporangium sp. 12N6]|uniref:sulfurtransferase n=1 Tax=Planosporangium spinosum TaxID=3402278 RepID=UPI003CFB1D7D